MLARYARLIADARGRNQRPDGVVFVAIGPLPVHEVQPDNWRVVVEPRDDVRRLEWAWCVGLDIELATKLASDERALAVCQAIADQSPRNLVLWETSTGKRWWIVDECGPWPRPYLLHEPDKSLCTSSET